MHDFKKQKNVLPVKDTDGNINKVTKESQVAALQAGSIFTFGQGKDGRGNTDFWVKL